MSNTTTLSQEMQQKMVQTVNAAQVMLSNIMEMPLPDFEEHVKNELDSNEALERNNGDEDASDLYDGVRDSLGDYSGNEDFPVRNSHTSEEDYSNFITIDQVPEDMRQRYNNDVRQGFAARQYDSDKPAMEIGDDGGTSYDSLLQQIGELSLNEKEKAAMTYIVGSLDERGYLAKSDETLIDELAFQEYIDISPETLHRLVDMLQEFEPRGIGAHNLQECMLLQLTDPDDRSPRTHSLIYRLARKVVRDHFDYLSNARWDKIQAEIDVDDETIHEIQNLIRRLNPRPGYGLYESIAHTAPTIIPDFYLYVEKDGHITVTLEKGGVPTLKVSATHQRIVEEHDRAVQRAKAEGRQPSFNRQQQEAYEYAVHKVEAAKAFIENVRRRNFTLTKVMEGIAGFQHDFFVGEDDESLLKPLKLQDVAEYAQVDISTVSRAVNAKYVQTEYGTYPLKHFFGSEFVSATGETVAQRQAMMAVRRLIEEEDPHAPLSDQAISERLKEEGMNVARRTVAKYRERMKFPIAQHRKRH